jgi:hypothetical protein
MQMGDSLLARITMNAANDQIFNDHVVQSSTASEIDATLQTMKKRDRSRRMLEAAVYTHRWVKERAETYGQRADAAQYLFDLVKYVREKVGVVKLVVPSDEMAYTVFETLNDRGLALSPLDLVKTFIPYCLRTSYRHGNPRDIGLDMVGFRCAADLATP